MKLLATAREIEPGQWFATAEGYRGAWGEGRTEEEALTDLRSAAFGWVAVRRRLGIGKPEGPEHPVVGNAPSLAL